MENKTDNVQRKLDFSAEVKELEQYQSANWWKPKKGSYKVVVLGEGELVSKKFGDDVVEQWNIPVEVNKERFLWSVTKGKTLSSLYGQIVLLAAKNENKATGLVFGLIVKFDGQKNEYTIPEAFQAQESVQEEGLK